MRKLVELKVKIPVFFSKEEESYIAYQKIWGLTQEEFRTLSEMTADKRQFMLRQQGNSVVAVLDLGDLKETVILSGSDKSVAIMENAIEKVGYHPEEWLPLFYEMIK